jgi:Protein of unknown function (DUF2442)
MLYTITQVIPEADHCLRLTYLDGVEIVVNLKSLIEQGGVFTALADPLFFAQVTLGKRGRYIEWQGQIDFCADALRREDCFVREAESMAS